jgi:glycosyltransferase involved in cell wall biosynthesis
MRIALLTRHLDGHPTNGFERYAHNLRDGLESQKAELVLVNQDPRWLIRPSGSLISPPYYDVVLPLFRMIRGQARADIYHALTDSQAVLFPFMKGKKVVTIHHVDLTPPGSPSEALFRRFYSYGTDLAVLYADHFICISEQTKRELMEHYHVDEEKITVVPQAIPPHFRPLPKPSLTIGYLGALRKRKNVEMVIRSFALMQSRYHIKDAKLAICGEGPDEGRLKDIARELGISDAVEFRGHIPSEKILETYNSFTIFAFPSFQEGFGFPILEAQACGLPVVVLKGAMVPEEVAEKAVACADEGEMADEFNRLLTDERYRLGLVGQGVEHAAKFSIESQVRQTLEVYEKVLL